MMITKPIGLYVHIPFCVRKCNYCDFCSFDISSVTWKEEYIKALVSEIRSYSERNLSVDSIFFGGGTPSILSNDEFNVIVQTIKECFEILPDTEFTVEANPGTVNKDKLINYVKCGVNRLSMGLQSIHQNELKTLGRIHNFDDFKHSFTLARSLGIKNINVDLMYGIPHQTKKSFEMTLQRVAELSPEHISLYGLILEEGTPFYKMQNELPLPSEDIECDMYYFAADYLRRLGYSHYEISNYAKCGRECRHNLKYWRCEEYIGLGLNAHSYFDGRRFENSDKIDAYLCKSKRKKEAETVLEEEAKAYEYVMLRLRLSEGFLLSEYESVFGKDFLKDRSEIIDRLCQLGLADLSCDRLSLTERGFYVSNSILNELL